ncbi:phytanoyl-CoA dioxygenase domain-containing protein 1 homolog [Dermatophagoides pteronyssinus]|uniref:phytanoyl-CoA dioxygenase domain-containing protein 1 homolog n=1 Tax=Dermatophagoides pteronyssinus TaxID=6956 RepID=UPI003F6762DE
MSKNLNDENDFDPDTISTLFNRNGYVLLENFLPISMIDELLIETKNLVEQYDPQQTLNNEEKEEVTVFNAGKKQSANEYFLGSSDKIRYFLEQDAWDEQNHCFRVSKINSLNKIGHALHWLNPVFKQFTFQKRFQMITRSIGLEDPLIVQSMVIFKNPYIGAEVPEHQDATFLYSTPEPRVVGIWIPLEDATETNGCLQFIPGSHRTHPLRKRWIRHHDPIDGRIQMKDQYGDWSNGGQEKTVHEINNDEEKNKLNKSNFVSVPAPKGSCILIDGLVVHRSDPNLSNKARPAYTFHIFDQGYLHDDVDDDDDDKQKILEHQSTTTTTKSKPKRQWDSLNWLQPTDQYSFPRLYCNDFDDDDDDV